MPKPKIREVRRAIKDTRKEYTWEDVWLTMTDSQFAKLNPTLLDTRYWAVPIETWQLILAWSGVDKKTYISDFFDCDNFAIAFSGEVAQRFQINSAGIVVDYSGKHAYTAILIRNGDDTLAIATIEPQSDAFILKTTGMYDAEQGFVLFG